MRPAAHPEGQIEIDLTIEGLIRRAAARARRFVRERREGRCRLQFPVRGEEHAQPSAEAPAVLYVPGVIRDCVLSEPANLHRPALLRRNWDRHDYGGERGGEFSARTRHVLALERAAASLQNARAALVTGTPELVAEDLLAAQHALGEIVGTFTSEDLLGAIFSTFCIGK